MQTRKFLDFEITDDPVDLVKRSEEEREAITLGYELAHIGNRSAIRGIKELIQKYPEEVAFKNYLVAAYNISGKQKKAIIANNELLKAHPDYLFARANAVVYLLKDKKADLDKVKALLGGDKMSLKSIYPNRDVFHISEVAAYYSGVGGYNLKIGNSEGAEEMLELLLDAGLEEHPLTEELGKKIIVFRMRDNLESISEGKENEVAVDSFPTVVFEVKEERPILKHKELEAFYTYNLDRLNETIMQEIIALPRETLVKDLISVLEDSIHRFEYMMTCYSDDDWDGNETSFSMHSLFFLGALKAEGALQNVLNLLRQGDEFIEWWYSDYFEDYFKPTLFVLGKDKLDDLKAFLLESNVDSRCKNIISEVLAQAVLHDVNRREEVLELFRSVISGIAKNEDDETKFDTLFLTYLIGSLIDIRAVELLPEIESLYKKGWINSSVQGTLEDVKTEIALPLDRSKIDPQPKNIIEFYTRVYEENREKPALPSENFLQKYDSKADQFITNLLTKMLDGKNDVDDDLEEIYAFDDYEDEDIYYHEPLETVRREEVKVGRNDPCPCGSGRKYKKCCWNK